jgi:hypothetical protein
VGSLHPWHVRGIVAAMGLGNQDGKLEGFDVVLILLMLFLLFGISLLIA